MPFDATPLWWPPFSRLYAQLGAAKAAAAGGGGAAAGADAAAALEKSLREYEGWMAKGVAGFRPPSAESRRALEGEGSLAIGEKRMPVDPALRPAALELSAQLVRL